MTDTRLYLGRPGSLAAIRSPRGTFESTRQRRTNVFGLGVGGAAVDQMIGGARTYTINYAQLTYADYTTLQAYNDGLEGPGPFVLLDPGQRNMLPANIAGATSVTNSPDPAPCVGGFDLLGILDDFNRAPVASGWGTLTTGQSWAITPTPEHSTIVGAGLQTHTSVNTFHNAVVSVGSADFNLYADVSVPIGTPSGSGVTQWLCGRWTDASNYYAARLDFTSGGSIIITLLRRVAGVLASAGTSGAVTISTSGHIPGTVWRIHFTGTATALSTSAWLRDTGSEPTTPQISTTDASLTTGSSMAVLTRLESGNTNTLPVVFSWSNIRSIPPGVLLTSSSAYTDAGPRILACGFSGAPSGGVSIGPDWPSSTFTYGIPVVAGRAVCLSAYLRGGGTDAITTWTPRIIWRDATGVILSTVTTGSGAVTSSAGAWAQLYATGTPPAGTVYADFLIDYTSGATSGAIAYLRRFMFNEGAVPDTTWAVGTGVWPVTFVSLDEAWPFVSPELRSSPVAVLVEDVS